MILGVYAIRDKHTGFMSLTTEQNDNCAMRNFAHAMQNVDSLLYTHPDDFDLFRLGDYDTDSGELNPNYPVKHILAGASLKGEN